MLLNCACSLDGRVAAPDGSPLLLSGPEDLRRVHEMRADCDAILVGVGTVLADDPSLRVKPHLAQGPDPLRVVLDTHGRTPADARARQGPEPALILTADDVATDAAGRLDLAAVLDLLAGRGIGSAMVEGGPTVLASFLKAGLVDRWTLYQAPMLVGGGPSLWPTPGEAPRLNVTGRENLGEGVLWTFQMA